MTTKQTLAALASPFLLAPLLLPGPGAAFEVKLPDPGFTVTVPRLPEITVRQPSPSPPQSSLRMAGDDGQTEVQVYVTSMRNRVSPRECAGSGLRSILSRPGLPSRDNVYRAPLSEKTFLVLYLVAGDRQHVLHAHLLSAVAGTHCTEVHFSRPAAAGEDLDGWRETFSGARIEDGAR
jgi:hypothetical protein